jgi:phospholipase C
MAFLTRDDLPFHFALADAFTVCDAYYCSFLGQAATVFQVRSGAGTAGPWTYTVGAHHDLTETWDFGASHETGYDLAVHGPNGFFRAFQGSLADRGRANLAVQTIYEPAHNALVLEIHNAGARLEGLHLEDAYARDRTVHALAPGERLVRRFALERSFGWYDVTLRVDSDPAFRRQVAGHVETGQDSMSDPLLGRPGSPRRRAAS